MCAPDKALCLTWVKEAWNSVTTKVVMKSFQVCGISVKTDSSEDGEIHCIKEGQTAAEALPTIVEKTVSLFEDSPEEDDCDPFDESTWRKKMSLQTMNLQWKIPNFFL